MITANESAYQNRINHQYSERDARPLKVAYFFTRTDWTDWMKVILYAGSQSLEFPYAAAAGCHARSFTGKCTMAEKIPNAIEAHQIIS